MSLPSESVDRAARDLVARGVVGVAVGVRDRNGGYVERAAGLADRPRALAMSPDRQFRIASISKTFVFGTILKLHEQGRLDIGEPIRRWTPDLPFADRVTLRHVLMQTGGLPVWATDRIDEIPAAAAVWSPRQVVDFHYARTPPGPPGGPMVYANVGSRLAGHIAELASGERLAALIRRFFLDPLGLRDTTPSGDLTATAPRLARGYCFDGDAPPRDVTGVVPNAWLWAGGDMYSTVADLTNWVQALFGGRVFGPEMTAALQRELVPGGFHGSTLSAHGLGIMVFTKGRDALGYRGSTPGFVSIVGWEPKSGLAVAVLTNGFSPDPNSIHRSGVETALFELLDAAGG